MFNEITWTQSTRKNLIFGGIEIRDRPGLQAPTISNRDAGFLQVIATEHVN